ncbi:hypothetical protein K7432_011228 [Basidiobolus ranarum]|uniref:Uncharacterized protein n=1 Tax=Basidiobolus ranarum TaxID=34480 RepID=A0ABR2WMP5_9FUNG
MSETKNVIIIGLSYAGIAAAKELAASLPKEYRIIAIERNEFAYHAVPSLRAAVIPGWEVFPKPLPVSLEEYLNCLSSPAFVVKFPQNSLIDPLPLLLYTNGTLLGLCGLQHKPAPEPYFTLEKSLDLQCLFDQQDLAALNIWLREVAFKSDTSTLITYLRTFDPDKSYINSSRTQVEWTSTCVQHSVIVLTGNFFTEHTKNLEYNNTTTEIIEHTDIVPQNNQTNLQEVNWKTIPKFIDTLSGGGFMGEYLRCYDWNSSSLGPIAQWPQSLLTAVSLCMASSFPMAVWWGPKFVLIYNDGYSVVAAGKHPWLFGKDGSDGWSEIWPTLKPMAESVMRGENCYSEDHLLFMTRSGFIEETYHTWSYIPIRQEDGSVGGLLNPSIESTSRVISERRLNTLRDLGATTAGAKCCEEVFSMIGSVLTENVFDVPFALFYTRTNLDGSTTDNDLFEEEEDRQSNDIFQLVETVGISNSHIAAPRKVCLSESEDNHPWRRIFDQVMKTKAVVLIDNLSELFDDLPTRGWDEPVRMAVACPIVGNDQDGILGMLLMGLNSRRSYDEDYKTFIELLSRQTGTVLATIRAYEDQVNRVEALAAIDRAKTSFFSSVSHELRTPLTLILGPIKESLADNSLTLDHKTRLNMVHRNSKRLLRLVNSLLDFSRIEAGRLQATYQETDLGKFTADLASVFRSAIEKGGLKFEVECDEGGKLVWVDPEMWEKIVFNLIGNAFKFTMKGIIKVNMGPSPDRTSVILTVSDTGSGIPPHEIHRIFERFHRVEGQRGRSHEGTGIGLSLTQELVKLHGGKVDVSSEFGRGSTFTITIPYGYTHLPPDQLIERGAQSIDGQNMERPWSYGLSVVEEARQWQPSDDEDLEYLSSTSSTDSSNSIGNTFPLTSCGSRILLVDDNADMRRYVKGLLSKWWQVVEAGNGEEAFNIALQNPPDLIVSDVMMPVLDGLGLLKVLRANQSTKFIPVVLLSARAGEEAKVEGLKSGADDFLVKPFSAKELVARVHTHLELGKLRTELERLVKERTKELAESELRYKVLAKLSPVGIFRLDLNGFITYTNDKWWEISGHDRRSDPNAVNFMSSIYPEDRERTTLIFKECIQSARGFIIEFRWGSNNSGVKWCQGEVIVEYDNQMKPHGFVGTLTDLTERKLLEKERVSALQLAEQQQRRRAEDAEEIKKQQELFIDMTCHELRNPLNGIYHNADFLHESLEKIQSDVRNESIIKVMNWLSTEIVNDLEAVATISLCAQHQKKIADDVLNMSKISMNLLVLAKTDFQPNAVVSNVLRMFETEVKLKCIDVDFIVAEGYSRMNVNWVKGDPTRLSQVLINFLTNAIRFTEKASSRRITVTLGASETIPHSSSRIEHSTNASDESDQDQDTISLSSSASSTGTVRYIQQYSTENVIKEMDNECAKPDLSDAVYIEISIQDSGVGMTSEEQASLFRRFTQVSPKTYAEFGGSGLGLFISKRLVELHGGGIKVNSVKGHGTTFSFFIKCERLNENDILKAEMSMKENQNIDVSRPKVSSPQLMEKPNLSHQKVVNATKPTTQDKKEKLVKSKLKDPKKSNSKMKQKNPPKSHQTPQSPEHDSYRKILVVEDNLINQRVLKRQLELAQFSVDVAKHGLEALELLRKLCIALILMVRLARHA